MFINGGQNVMKKHSQFRISIITLVIIALIVITGISQIWFAKHGKSILEDYAKRTEEETVETLVYIGENQVALASNIDGDVDTLAVAKAAFIEVNKSRIKAGLPAFNWSDTLKSAAAIRAKEVTKKWSHYRPDGSEYWTVDVNSVYGENISKGFRTADAAVVSWMESETHRTNLLDADYQTMAIYVYEGKDGNWYWVTEFGK